MQSTPIQISQEGNILKEWEIAPSIESTKTNPIVVQLEEGYPIRAPNHMGAYDVASTTFNTAKEARKLMKKEFATNAFYTSIEMNDKSYSAFNALKAGLALPDLETLVLWGSDSCWD